MTIPAELIQMLGAATRVTGFTGAGVPAESGVPTFRDAQTNLWTKYPGQKDCHHAAVSHGGQCAAISAVAGWHGAG